MSTRKVAAAVGRVGRAVAPALRLGRVAAPLAAGVLALAAGLANAPRAHADGETDPSEKHERCATRVSVALTGKSAPAALMTSTDPQSAVEGMLQDDDFQERFARFINASFNPEPGMTVADDPAYTLARYVLKAGNLPWKEMFVGKYRVTDTVATDAQGLGYFRSRPWMIRFAGNEQDGYRLPAAYRIMQNTTGLELTATTNVEGADLTAGGRMAAGCKSCHYDNWYALDLVAKILSRRRGANDQMTFVEPNEGPQTILDGKTIANDAQLVDALVASENYSFNACRLAFTYLYGRAEYSCEGAVFDKCVDAFKADGKIQSALAAIAKDPSFCE